MRFSGFLRGAVGAPNHLLNEHARIPGRILALAITPDRVIARVFPPASAIESELREASLPYLNVFRILEIGNRRRQLLRRLREIHEK
ncbi:MAG: MvaI/BcnI restriction endonuclease family protein, partial [Thermoanaerobaculia bacterium]